MAIRNRSALIKEGRKLVTEQEASGWRLAEIVHELREDGMTHQQIADELGWKKRATARAYDEVLVFHGKQDFASAYRLVRLSDDEGAAAVAISESEGRAISTTVETRRPEIKAIAAEIANLPQEEKEQIARELATGDREFTSAVNKAQFEDASRRREASARRKASDHVGRKFDERVALYDLQAEVSKFVQKAVSLIPDIGAIPEAERYWLTGEAERLEYVAGELRYMAENGETRTDSELRAITEAG